MAAELLARQLQISSAAAAFGNRDRGGPPGAAMAAYAAAPGGLNRGAGAPSNAPVPVVVVGWSEMWKQLKSPAPRTPRAEAAAPEAGGGVAKALASQFGRVIAPLLAFGTILSANNSGMTTFQKAVNVLAVSLAPILLPAVVLLSAGLLTVADHIWAKLLPRLSSWTAFILENGIPAVEKLVEKFDLLADGVTLLYDLIHDPRKTLDQAEEAARSLQTPDGIASGADNLGRIAGGVVPGPFGDIIGRAIPDSVRWAGRQGDKLDELLGTRAPAAESPTGPGALTRLMDRGAALAATMPAPRPGSPGGTQRPGEPGSGGGLAGNLNDVLTSLTRSLLPKAEYTSAAGAAKARQLAGANGDPLDMKALLRSIESVREVSAGVKTAVERLDKPTAQAPPNGGY